MILNKGFRFGVAIVSNFFPFIYPHLCSLLPFGHNMAVASGMFSHDNDNFESRRKDDNKYVFLFVCFSL